MQDTLKIGLITKPHGVRGELRVTPLTDDPARFKRLKNVFIDGKTYGVLGATVASNAVILSLSGVADRSAAELLRGKFLTIDRSDAVPLKKGDYFIADLIGCRIVTENGNCLCTVEDVISAKTDVIVAKTDDGTCVRFPFLKDVLVAVDVAAGVITVKEKRFGEISLYEN